MKNLWYREPTLIIAFVQFLLALAIAFGVDISVEQRAAVIAVVTSLLELYKRSQVTPVADPKLPNGN